MKSPITLAPHLQPTVEANLSKAFWASRKFRPPIGMEQEDWEAECRVCLVKAVMGHNPALGTLSTILETIVHRRRVSLNRMAKRQRRSGVTISLDAAHDAGKESILNQIKGPEFESERLIAIREFCAVVLREIDPRAVTAIKAMVDGQGLKTASKILGVSITKAFRIAAKGRQEAASKRPDEVVAGKCQCKRCGVLIPKYFRKGGPLFCGACLKERIEDQKRQWFNAVGSDRRRTKRKAKVSK